MPRGDGTGPNGMGPMTGRAAGFCAGNNMPGYAAGFAYGRGRGFGRGMGGGFGRRNRNMFNAAGRPAWAQFGAAPAPADEKEFLKNQAEYLESEIAEIRKRLEELDK
ncbi:MAG: DUF5320 domain-containing protein [Lentisphaerae bacterium]|jgi:hypothetical protein|nr:DUF5320 domain-containing protein [Lentisphaerota bacterium]